MWRGELAGQGWVQIGELAMAFAISLVRDRLYAQDLSDMEAIASQLELGQVELETVA